MGTSNVADCLTGVSIAHRDPVVAFVVEPVRGGYPDAADTIAKNRFFGSICRIASLPIHGTYDDYGGIEPHRDQLAVDLACRMVGAEDWKAFSSTALDWQTGASIQEGPAHRRLRREEPPKEVFGLALMHASSWQHLLDGHPNGLDRTRDARSVAEALADAAAQVRNADASDRGMAVGRAYGLLQLGMHRYTYADGRTVRLPMLASAFGGGDDNFGGRFTSWMTSGLGPLAFDILEGSAQPRWLPELLDGIWCAQVFALGMDYRNRSLLSSAWTGQQALHGLQVSVAALTVEQAVKAEIDRAVDFGEPTRGLQAVEEALIHLDEVREKLRARLEAVHAGFDASSNRAP